MRISKADIQSLYSLKGKLPWENMWTWVGESYTTQRFINRMVKAGAFIAKEGAEGYADTYHPTQEFIDWITCKEFVENVKG